MAAPLAGQWESQVRRRARGGSSPGAVTSHLARGRLSVRWTNLLSRGFITTHTLLLSSSNFYIFHFVIIYHEHVQFPMMILIFTNSGFAVGTRYGSEVYIFVKCKSTLWTCLWQKLPSNLIGFPLSHSLKVFKGETLASGAIENDCWIMLNNLSQ